MKGLRTQESNNFIKFFELVQCSAGKMGKVFFLDCEDGNDRVVGDLEVCDLSGWLIPQDKADEFEKVWMEHREDDDWVDFFGFVSWNDEHGLSIEFSQ